MIDRALLADIEPPIRLFVVLPFTISVVSVDSFVVRWCMEYGSLNRCGNVIRYRARLTIEIRDYNTMVILDSGNILFETIVYRILIYYMKGEGYIFFLLITLPVLISNKVQSFSFMNNLSIDKVLYMIMFLRISKGYI